MTRVTINAILRQELKDLTQVLELCDEQGQVIAHLYPTSNAVKRPPCEPPQLSKEEWERRRNGEWLTTGEAIVYLEKLGCFR
jgi:hypothetical protein